MQMFEDKRVDEQLSQIRVLGHVNEGIIRTAKKELERLYKIEKSYIVWQPIETASRDGRKIIAWVEHLGIGVLVLHWKNHAWRDPCMNQFFAPTHWLPEPEPPFKD